MTVLKSSIVNNCLLVFITTVLVFTLLSCSYAAVPEDIIPINVYESEESASYPVFRGTILDGESRKTTPMLHDFQGFRKIGRHYYIYARDHIFVVDVENDATESEEIPHKQVVTWKSSDNGINLCMQKGQSRDKCKSYIKLFEEVGVSPQLKRQVTACSTNAFSPTCRTYQVQATGELKEAGKGPSGSSSLCPNDPSKNVASIFSDGNLFTATVAGFNAHDPLMYVYRSSTNLLNLRTTRRATAMLNDPHFIRFIDGGRALNKVYVFFKETAIEDNSFHTYSRVGQACKNDEGGSNLLRGQFSSFFKARLNCSLPGQPPFYFNELVDVTEMLTLDSFYTANKQKLVFALMNTPSNSIPGSAICAFTLDDVEKSLNGAFMEQQAMDDRDLSYWDKLDDYPKPHLASCQMNPRKLSSSELNFVKKHPIMYNSVAAWNLVGNSSAPHNAIPIFTRTNARQFLTTIIADTEAGTSSMYTVFICGTSDGKIVKILLLDDGSTAVIEERMIFNGEKCAHGDPSVKKIGIDKEAGNMMVAFRNCVIRAPLCPMAGNTCGRKCIESRDPYCGWDNDKCVTVDMRYKGTNPGAFQARQDVIDGNVDGMPKCKPLTEIIPNPRDVAGGGTAATLANETGVSNTTLVGGATREKSTVIKEASMSFLILIICAASGVLFGVLITWFFCHLRARSCQQKVIENAKDVLELKRSNDSNGNGHIVNRNGSNRSKARHASASSHHSPNRHGNQRSSLHSDTRRTRTITDNSQGNRSDEGTVYPHGDADNNPEVPSVGDNQNPARTKQLKSTSSNVVGRRGTRTSKPSVSSGPENHEYHGSPQTPFPPGHFPYHHYEDAFHDDPRQRSDDSGRVTTPPESDEPLMHNPSAFKTPRALPGRSQSFQVHHQLPRAYTLDSSGKYNVGNPRPHGKVINRQLSLQIPDGPHKPMYAPQPRFNTPQAPPPNMPSEWVNQPQDGSNATSNKNPDNRRMADLTHSLDRRRKPKGVNYQLFPEQANEQLQQPHQQQQSAPMQNGNQNRKRYMSESEKNNRVPMLSRPIPYQAIHEEQEPLLHPLPGPQDSNDLRHKLFLNLNQINQGPGNSHGLQSAPIAMDSPNFAQSRGLLRRQNPHSNPGTPLKEMPPPMPEVNPAFSNRHGNAGLPVQNGAVPSDLILAEQMERGFDTDRRSNPTKSNPSTPMQDGRPPSFPNADRSRHYSGQMNMQPMPSPVKTTAPVSFGSGSYNPQLANSKRSRNSSGVTGQSQNAPAFSAIPHEMGQPRKTSPNTPPFMQIPQAAAQMT